MQLLIQKSGISAIQDMGRPAGQEFGIPRGGAADALSHRLANIAVGNPETAATVECCGGHWQAVALTSGYVAHTGAGGKLFVNGAPFPHCRPVGIPQGAVIEIRPENGGVYSYLAVSGGWEASVWLGSCSTSLAARAGGLDGRLLQKGDNLHSGTALPVPVRSDVHQSDWYLKATSLFLPAAHGGIRILQGPEWDAWPASHLDTFLHSEWQVSMQSNRMGIRLEGVPVPPAEAALMATAGVVAGTIQVPPGGLPIILMADCQPTGGYARIGQVAAIDLPRLAQLPARSYLKFELISLEEAEQLYFVQESALRSLRQAVQYALRRFFPS